MNPTLDPVRGIKSDVISQIAELVEGRDTSLGSDPV